jgi:nucleotide-binding universal stress UspA family protein
MKNIVLAVDFSEITEKMVEKAAKIASKLMAKIWIVHVAAPDPDFVGYDVGPQYIRDDRAEELHEEHQMLQNYAANLKKKGIDAEALLIQGYTAQSIIKQAEQVEADMIIIGSHGHGPLYNTIVGSVTSDVLKDTPIPVTVIPVKLLKD